MAGPDVAGFTAGQTSVFNSKGHSKAGGVEVSFRYPSSWRIAEGDRPHVVQKVSARDGSGASCMLMIVTNEQIHAADLASLLEPSEMRSMMPPTASFIGSNKITIDGQDGGEVIYSANSLAGSQVINVQTAIYFTGYEGVLVQFVCGVASVDSSADLSRRFAEYEPLFRLMLNSLVLQDKWNKNMEATVSTADNSSKVGVTQSSQPGTPLASSATTFNWLEAAIRFAITWGVGLLPSLIARYAIYKRPVPRKNANWIAGVGSVFFALCFMVLNAAAGGKSNPVAWVIIFFVARWVMTRGAKPEPVKEPLA